ncbi:MULTISPECIES: hypothetical protein [Providencia]|uniref:hypothetical protein n=1 Tax=Providencia TaxID=586 RepID=UPI0018C681FE|nr:hypothetical protein [Providencia rettgeri]MBG5927892.1 hypothetical protein [Providencia rettgeri]
MANGHAYVVQKRDSNNNPILEYNVIVDGKIVNTFGTQKEAADWALGEGYPTHVARVRDMGSSDIDNPNHWREY